MKSFFLLLLVCLFCGACQISIPQNDSNSFTSFEQKKDLLFFGACMDSKENIHIYQYLTGYHPTFDYSANCYIQGVDFLYNYARDSHYVDAWNTIANQCGGNFGYGFIYRFGIKPMWKDFQGIFLDYPDSSAIKNLMTCPVNILAFGLSAGLSFPITVAISAVGSVCVFSAQTLYVVAQPPIGFAFETIWGTSALVLGTTYQTVAAPFIIPLSKAPTPNDFSSFWVLTLPCEPKTPPMNDKQRQTYDLLQQQNIKAIERFQKSIIGLQSSHFNEMSQLEIFIHASKIYCENATLGPTPTDLKILSLAGFTNPQLAAICDYLAQQFNP